MQLPGYEFDEKIGEGGMAAVFKGRQLSLARPVAIKILNQQMRAHSQVRQAFERESLIIARLNHPNIIQVIDRGVSAQRTPYFVMEYVQGVELTELLRDSELAPARKIELCLQVCKALAYAHKNRVIHGDIKPGNVIVDSEHHVKVLDFGIAQFYRGAGQQGDEPPAAAVPDSDIQVMGTLTYMAPELAYGGAGATFSSDIYSLGVMMHEVFTAQLPQFVAAGVDPFPADVPVPLKQLIGRCLQHSPEARPASVGDIHNQLLLLLSGAHLNHQQVKRARESVASDGVDKKTFTLLDIISENKYGAVYLFMEKNSRRQLVVKKISGNHDGYHTSKRMASLAHRHLVRVHGVSKNPRAFIVVMDYLQGGSLQDRLIRRYRPDQFLPIARQICSALAYAHRNQVVHGNLRASNVLFDSRGNVRIADFGLPPHYENSGQNWYRPAQEPPGPQIDIYACGVVFYQMLVGELPRRHRQRLATGRALERLPAKLRDIIVTMLETDPRRRFQQFGLVLDALSDLNEAMPTAIIPPSSAVATRPQRDKKNKQILLLLLLVLLFLIVVDAGTVILFTNGLLDPGALQALFQQVFRQLFEHGF